MRAPPDDFDLTRARDLYWQFHWGIPPGREIRVRGPKGVPRGVTQLGTLVGLELAGGYEVWPKADAVQLATDDRGRNLFLVAPGGVFGNRTVRPGRIRIIRYRTNKGTESGTWWHPFEGTRPLFTLDEEGFPVIRRAGSKFRVTWRGIVG